MRGREEREKQTEIGTVDTKIKRHRDTQLSSGVIKLISFFFVLEAF